MNQIKTFLTVPRNIDSTVKEFAKKYNVQSITVTDYVRDKNYKYIIIVYN